VDADEPARRQSVERVGVPVQQYVHTGAGEQVVQPHGAPGRVHVLVGQPIPGAEPTLPPGRSFH